MKGLILRRVGVVALFLLATLGGSPAPTRAQSVVTTIPVGSNPNGLAVNATTNRIYVANQSGNTVSVVNGASNAVVATIPVANGPVAVAVNATTNRIFVTSLTNVVSVIDGASNSVVATIPVGKEPSRLLVNPTTNRVYVINFQSDNVSVIDGSNNTVIATIAVGIRPTAEALNPTTNRIYVTDTNGNTVTVIDGNANTVIATTPVGQSPQGVAVIPSTNQIYVANNGGNSVSVLDGTSNTVVATIPVGTQPLSIAANPATNRVYVGNFASNNVSVIDGASRAVSVTIPVGTGPSFVSINQTLNHVYVANESSNNVSVIDGNANSVIATLSVGTGPIRVEPNATTNRAYVVNGGSNSVSVIQDAAPAPPTPPPTTASTWFFAEGSTQAPFQTWFLVQNPGSTAARVRFSFQLQGGGTVTRDFTVGPTSRFSLFTNQVIPNVAFSTRIDADQPVFAERSMFVSFEGDVVTGIKAPNRTWLFAEGSTQNPFQTWLLLENPNSQTATATITYLLLGGGTPVTQTLSLPPLSRTSVFVNQVLPNAAFSSRVTSDQPIVVERSMFRFPGNAATDNPGVNQASPNWFFAEGNTTRGTTPFDTFLLLQNPNNTPASATITLFRQNGAVTTLTQQLPALSRQSVFLNQVLPGARFGIRVQASQPVIAERSEFFGPEPRGALSTQGATGLATIWFLPEGSTQPPFREQIAILNPNSSAMTAHIDFQLPSGQIIGRDFTISPTREFTLDVATVVPNSPVSAKITTSQPSVVERLMFFTKPGGTGATDTIGVAG